MDSKTQVGLEYLMTYGWALVLIAAVVGMIVFIVGSPVSQVSFSSSDQTKLLVKAADVDGATGEAEIVLQNITGGPINVSSVSFFGDLWPSADFKFNGQSSFPVDVVAGGEMHFEGLLSSTNCGAGGTIAIFYTDAFGFEREAKVTCNGGVAMPVAYYKFDEGSGETAYDSSGNGNDGTLYNMGESDWVDGPSGTALNFDGINNYVEVTNIAVDTLPGARNTVEFLMYWNGAYGVMPFSWNQSYDLFLSGDCFGFNTTKYNVYGVSSAGLANKWVHVRAIFYNGVPSIENNALYFDGVKQNINECQYSTTASRSVTTTAYVGAWGGDFPFDGKIDEVKIYNLAIGSVGSVGSVAGAGDGPPKK